MSRLSLSARAFRLLDDDDQLIGELLEAAGVWYSYARWGAILTLGPFASYQEAAEATESAWRARGYPRQILQMPQRSSAGGGR